MTDSMMPIIRQMHDAESDADRARILLSVPDLVLAKYCEAFTGACRRARFDLGEEYVLVRLSVLRAVRDHMGNLPAEMALHGKTVRAALVAAQGVTGAGT